MSCGSVRGWLHVEASTLDESQQLLLDDHLASCETCRGDRERLLLVREAGRSLDVPGPSAREYSRAIAAALLEGRSPRTSARAPRWWIPAGALALAAIAVVVVARLRGTDDVAPTTADRQPPTPAPVPVRQETVAPAPAPAPESDRVEDGTLVAGAATLTAGDPIPADTRLRTTAPVRLRVASLRVTVAAASELRWSPIERTLLLDRGSIEVDAADDRLARVVTAAFDVELANANVSISSSTVRVARGTAHVGARTGKLLAHLEAGAAWSPELAKSPPPPRKQVVPEPTAAELLAQARALFAAKDVSGAAALAERAVGLATSRRDEADTRIFLADLAQASGALDVAVSRYEAVATRFAELPAAESALYAAARIELRRGNTAAARTLLDRYLARYPSGRYADDVRRQQEQR